MISCALMSTVHGITYTFSSFPFSLTHSFFAPSSPRGLVLLCLLFKVEVMMGRGNAVLLQSYTHKQNTSHTQTQTSALLLTQLGCLNCTNLTQRELKRGEKFRGMFKNIYFCHQTFEVFNLWTFRQCSG